MVINTTGVVAEPPKVFITEAGKYFFKLESIEDDGYSQEGNQKLKLNFTGVRVKDGKFDESTKYSHQVKNICADANLVWIVAAIRDALKSPELFEINDWIGRYIIGNIYMRERNGKMYAQIGTWEYASQNDSLPPLKEVKEVKEQKTPEIDIDDDKIPF